MKGKRTWVLRINLDVKGRKTVRDKRRDKCMDRMVGGILFPFL